MLSPNPATKELGARGTPIVRASAFIAAALLLCGIAASCASEVANRVETASPAPSVSAASKRQQPKPRLSFERVTIVGASVSAGFINGPFTGGSIKNRSVPLATMVRTLFGKATVSAHPNVLMFQDPPRLGRGQVGAARAIKPTLTLALDFLFWFGYGDLKSTEQRLALQRVGFDLLSKLPGTVVVGDYPDMRDASASIIAPVQIPSTATLAELNRALKAFATSHPRIRVFPLADWIRAVKGRGYASTTPAGCKFTIPSTQLLQTDRLHAARLGMAVLSKELEAFLGRAPTRLQALAEAAGAGEDLRRLVQKQGCSAAPQP